MKKKFIIGVGSNINNPDGLEPIETCQMAIKEIENFNISVVKRSSWYISEPMPKSNQPNFYNSAIMCYSKYDAKTILKILQFIEKKYGRIRIFKNMDRCLDLDLITFENNVKKSLMLTLPHPRMHLRKFVLLPFHEIEPNWLHPIFKKKIDFFLNNVKFQKIKKIKMS